jgi:hypothetical protein
VTDPTIQTTIASPIEYYKLEVMRDVINLKEAWEFYFKNRETFPVDLYTIKARTRSLFISLVAHLKRKWSIVQFEKIRSELFNADLLTEDRLLQIMFDMQIQLDQDNITKMDSRKSYDSTMVEKENKMQGFG